MWTAILVVVGLLAWFAFASVIGKILHRGLEGDGPSC